MFYENMVCVHIVHCKTITLEQTNGSNELATAALFLSLSSFLIHSLTGLWENLRSEEKPKGEREHVRLPD